MKKIIALLLMIANVVSAQQTAGTTGTLDPTQVYTTGNIVQPTIAGTGQTPWVNGIYQDQLTCWAWGNPGNCGPNPSVRPGGYINYSFGYTDLHQVQAIASILPTTGLRVNGYNFGFTAKNGNGWDDGRVDQLNAYVSFYGTDGKVVDYTNYNLNSKFNWTTFNYSKDFVTPYADKDLSKVQYGFVGKDNNYWAGNYGPEIMNVSFSLKYSVDPCAVNVLSSPTCPGYTEALLKSLPTTTTTTDPLAPVAGAPAPPPPPEMAPPPPQAPAPSSPGQPGVASVVSAPAPPPPPAGPAPTTSASTSTSSTVQTTKETTSSGSGNVGLALSIISKNQERDAAGSAVAQTAMAQAQAQANQAQQEASSVASNAVANSTTMNAVSVGGQQSNGNGIRVNMNTNSVQSSSSASALTTTMTTTFGSFTGPNVVASQQSLDNVSTTITTQVNYNTSTTNLNTSSTIQTNELYQLMPPNFLTDKSNPMNDIIDDKQSMPQNSMVTLPGPVVNKNVGDNDIAGGISINRMALAPVGYGDYLNFTMKDAAFYAPKEVYRNQRNVDNARALRQMTSDSKHKEMVEMQYAK